MSALNNCASCGITCGGDRCEGCDTELAPLVNKRLRWIYNQELRNEFGREVPYTKPISLEPGPVPDTAELVQKKAPPPIQAMRGFKLAFAW